MPAPAAQAWVGERLCGLRASGGGFDRKRSECLFARAARGGRGRRGHPVGVCSAFAVWTHPQPLNERCNVTGGGEGGELRNGQGGASVSSAPDCLPPSRVTIHQSRVYPTTHLHVGVVCSSTAPSASESCPSTLSGCECGLHPFLVHAPPSRASFFAQTSLIVAPPILVCSAYSLHPFFLGQWLLSGISGHGATLGQRQLLGRTLG